jgi:hypothetical protein
MKHGEAGQKRMRRIGLLRRADTLYDGSAKCVDTGDAYAVSSVVHGCALSTV